MQLLESKMEKIEHSIEIFAYSDKIKAIIGCIELMVENQNTLKQATAIAIYIEFYHTHISRISIGP